MTLFKSKSRYQTGQIRKKRKPAKIQTLQFYIVRENGTPLPLQNKPWFLWAIAAFVAISLLSVAGTARLAATVADSILASERLAQKLASLHQRHDIFKNSADLLMARIVVAKERANDQQVLAPPKAVKKQEPQTLAVSPPKPAEEAPGRSVDVRDFHISHNKEGKTLKVEYSLVNTQEEGAPVSGRAYVVLGEKPALVSDIHRKRSSRNKLTSGNPFSIQRFKRIEFSVGDDVLEKEFQSAFVFVFTGTGELLIEKQWDIDIQPS